MNNEKQPARRGKPLIRAKDPLALKRHFDRLLAEAGGVMSSDVRGHVEAARQAALDEFIRAESRTLDGSNVASRSKHSAQGGA